MIVVEADSGVVVGAGAGVVVGAGAGAGAVAALLYTAAEHLVNSWDWGIVHALFEATRA